MRSILIMTILAAALLSWPGADARGTEVDGTIKLGGVIIDEQAGDLAAVQETYNLEEGFSFTQLRLNGNFDPKTYFSLDLANVNLRNRRGEVEFRVPSLLRFYGRYDQWRQVFDPERTVTSDRKDWRFGAIVTPKRWFTLYADYGYVSRDGDRLAFPAGTASVFGTRYDYALHTFRVEGEVHQGPRTFALAYDRSDYRDGLSEVADRKGFVASGRVFTPCRFDERLTHFVRAAYGQSELDYSGLDYTIQNIQYTGVFGPIYRVQLRYSFFANRTDDESTELKTDDFRHDVDATYFHRYGSVFAGYGYETNDDDRSLTSYNLYTVGGSFNYRQRVNAKIEYASRNKKDLEKLTLLKDVESSRFRAKVAVQPMDRLTVGADAKQRRRDFPDIGVEAEGLSAVGFAKYEYEGWGSLGGEYTYAADEYEDLAGDYETESHIVTSRVVFDRLPGVRLGGGLTYLDVGKDLDIEKSIGFVEAEYTFREDYHLELKYNVYNYDDYIILDRYYTANVVWINVAYDFRTP